METIVIGNEAWWREIDGEWQYGVEPGDSVDPLTYLASYASPRFYLEAFEFDSLVLTPDGSEEIGGESTHHVKLDKQEIIDLLDQGTGVAVYPEGDPGPVRNIQGNAMQVLPENFTIDVWFADDGGFPVRLLITFSDAAEHPFFGFEELRLQMDITDPHAQVTIEPPVVN